MQLNEAACTTNIVLIGSMGVGKSTLGRLLARTFKRPFYDSDEVIEERCGAKIPWIFDLEGESGFRQREVQVIDELTQLQGIVLATGGGTILRLENREKIRQTGVVVFLRTTVEQQLLRLSDGVGSNRPLLKTANPRQRLEALRQEREALYEQTAHIIVDTDERPPRQMLLIVRNRLTAYFGYNNTASLAQPTTAQLKPKACPNKSRVGQVKPPASSS